MNGSSPYGFRMTPEMQQTMMQAQALRQNAAPGAPGAAPVPPTPGLTAPTAPPAGAAPSAMPSPASPMGMQMYARPQQMPDPRKGSGILGLMRAGYDSMRG